MAPKRNYKKGGGNSVTSDEIKNIEKIMDISKLDRDGKFINPYITTFPNNEIKLSYKYNNHGEIIITIIYNHNRLDDL